MEKILVVDNYDSFTYNLVHYLEADGQFHVDVKRNDELSLSGPLQYPFIVLSPGPGLPDEAGFLKDVIKNLQPDQKMLGVCLGLQAIAEVFNGSLKNLNEVYHGVASSIRVLDKDDPLFKGLPASFQIGHYHSWVANPENISLPLMVTAIDEQGEIMAIRHQHLDLCAVQFHPESVLTEHGEQIIRNWLYS